jgi:YtkA-like
MKRAAIGLLLACLAAGCSNNAPGTSVTQGTTTGAGMEIQFRSEADPPASGDNTFEVIVAKDGVRVDDAQVNAALSMPAMPSMNMPEMHTSATLEPAGDGRYRGTARLSMPGTWNVRVTVTRNGQELGIKTLSIVAK